MTKKATHVFIISTFVTLYLLVSIISTIHVIDFFLMSNPKWLAVSLAIAFEVGAAASLASIITLDKMNKGIVWGLFILLTLMQAMGNTYYTYIHLNNYQGWIELFGLVDEELIYQKRVLSIVSGAILPIVALGFIKSLVDYIKPAEDTPIVVEPSVEEPVQEQVQTIQEEEVGQPVQDIVQVEPIELEIQPEVQMEESPIEDNFDDQHFTIEETPEQVVETQPEVESAPVDEILTSETSTEENSNRPKVDNIVSHSSSVDEALARGKQISFTGRV